MAVLNILRVVKPSKLLVVEMFGIYRFNKDDPSGPARNNASFKVNALKSYHINQPKFGIKYPTWLHGIRSYDLANGLSIDYRHSVLIGVIKLKLKL